MRCLCAGREGRQVHGRLGAGVHGVDRPLVGRQRCGFAAQGRMQARAACAQECSREALSPCVVGTLQVPFLWAGQAENRRR